MLLLNDTVKNWIKKANNDFKIAHRELKANNPVKDMICFHMQQCVEKYLKAFLSHNNVSFRKTHDIAELIESCKDIDPEFNNLYDLEADSLTIYGVEIRYPDDFYIPTLNETKNAVEITIKVKKFILDKIKKQDEN